MVKNASQKTDQVRSRKQSNTESLASQKERIRKEKERQRKLKQIRRFVDEEAELGSDDEVNDDVRKNINRDSDEENEDGLDSDLASFVAGDDEEIGDEDSEMMMRFNRDMEIQDKLEIQRTLNAVLYGNNNKKRTRVEALGLESEE